MAEALKAVEHADAARPQAAPPPPEPPPPPPRKRRPFEGWGTATGRGLAVAGRFVAHVSVLLFGHVRATSGKAYADFQKKDRHTRYRAYALGGYGCIAVVTLMAQLYHPNSIGAYVRVEHVDFPRSIAVFIRNDSEVTWRSVKVTLDRKYGYERPAALAPNDSFQMRVDRFAALDRRASKSGLVFAPPELLPREILVECDRGSFVHKVGAKE